MAKILVAEHDWETNTALASELRRIGHEVVTVTSAAGALERLAAERIDVLLGDLDLEPPDGRDLLGAVARVAPRTACIWLRHGATAEDYRRGVERGAVDVLTLPIELGELARALDRALDGSDKCHGILHGLDLIDLLQVLHQSRRSVLIRAAGGAHGIYMREGEIVHAAAPPLSGRTALRAILGLTSGGIDSAPLPPCEQTIQMPFEALLLDALRENDEEGIPLVDEIESSEAPVASSPLEPDHIHLDRLEPTLSDAGQPAQPPQGVGMRTGPLEPMELRRLEPTRPSRVRPLTTGPQPQLNENAPLFLPPESFAGLPSRPRTISVPTPMPVRMPDAQALSVVAPLGPIQPRVAATRPESPHGGPMPARAVFWAALVVTLGLAGSAAFWRWMEQGIQPHQVQVVPSESPAPNVEPLVQKAAPAVAPGEAKQGAAVASASALQRPRTEQVGSRDAVVQSVRPGGPAQARTEPAARRPTKTPRRRVERQSRSRVVARARVAAKQPTPPAAPHREAKEAAPQKRTVPKARAAVARGKRPAGQDELGSADKPAIGLLD